MSQTRRDAAPDAPDELRVPVAPDVTLHVERRDGDPGAVPFVLVHGLASNLRLWDGVAEELHAPRPHRGGGGPARPRPLRRAGVALRHGHRGRAISRR